MQVQLQASGGGVGGGGGGGGHNLGGVIGPEDFGDFGDFDDDSHRRRKGRR